MYIVLNMCKLLLLVMVVCSEFHKFTPYIEMHIDLTLVRARNPRMEKGREEGREKGRGRQAGREEPE